MPSPWRPQKITREAHWLKCKKQGLLSAQYKSAGTSSKQLTQQWQKEVPCPSRGHYLKVKPRKVTLAGFGIMGSILIGLCLGTFHKFYFWTLPVACQVFLLADLWVGTLYSYLYFPDGYPVTSTPSLFWGLECFTGSSLHMTQDRDRGKNGGTFVLYWGLIYILKSQ